MFDYERQIRSQSGETAKSRLLGEVIESDRSLGVRRAINELTDRLVELEGRGWNGIWARILSNFLTTACLGKFSVVVGNPPWIDWKNLPQGYREKIKSMYIERGLFSGAGLTGGINLNICALIAYVSMTNWLAPEGRLAFLMPRELVNQASYEGWRRLGGTWSFLQFDDWTEAGHPFEPVREDFMTFVIGRSGKKFRSLPVRSFARRRGAKISSANWTSVSEALKNLSVCSRVAGQIVPDSTSFTIANDQRELDEFALVAGKCEYIGREGIQFYPQEMQIFLYLGKGPSSDTALVTNLQSSKSQYRVPKQRTLLEKEYLYPLVTARSIEPFQHNYDGHLVSFPYNVSNPRQPITPASLRNRAPFLYAYYSKHRDILEGLSSFNMRIRGQNPGAFYGLARTGAYSFADVYVAFRKDTRWCSVVVSDQCLPWGVVQSEFVFKAMPFLCANDRKEAL